MDTASDNETRGKARWSLRLLGEFELTAITDGERVAVPGKRERVLLAYLAVSPEFRQPRRKLVSLLWGDAADETMLDNLRTCVFNLRKALGDSERRVIASEERDIVLDPASFEVDVLALRRLAGGPGRRELEEASKLYRGEFLDGLGIESEEFESWRREESARCTDQVLEALNRLMNQLAEAGETDRAIEAGLRILRLEPLHEAAARQLMRLYDRSDRRGVAIQLYRTLAESLRTEFNAQPRAETRSVFAELSRREERIAAAAGADAKSLPLPASTARPGETGAEPPPRPAEQVPPAGGGEERAGSPASAPAQPTSTSIAVLPFANMSGDATQEYFSDGMTEEITTALAKIPNLRVVARTSAFQFKGQNQDARVVGQSLSATHLIEGSVRKASDRVRISVQLIRVQDGTHVWSENYDRKLTDVFAIQEDIAQATALSLRVPLGLREGQSLVSNRMSDTESYQNYLRARALVRTRGSLEPGGSLTEAARLLEQVVVRDPNYAPAWGLLGQAHSLIPSFSAALVNGATDELRRASTESLQRADATAQQATRLDHNVDGYTALAFARNYRGAFVQAEALFKHALSLDPGNPEALHQYSLMLAGVGLLKEALPIRLRLQAQEPLVPIFNRATAEVLWLNGRNDDAITILKALPPTFGPRLRLAEVYASVGRYDEAADALDEVPAGIFSREAAEEAIRILRTAPARAHRANGTLCGTRLGFVHLYTGSPDRVLDFFEGLAEAGYPALGNATCRLWAPSYAPVRKSDRFKAFVRKAGMVEFWQARGWPELCRAVGADDFVCD